MILNLNFLNTQKLHLKNMDSFSVKTLNLFDCKPFIQDPQNIIHSG